MERKGLKRPADRPTDTEIWSKIARLVNEIKISVTDISERLQCKEARVSTPSTQLECPVCLEK